AARRADRGARQRRGGPPRRGDPRPPRRRRPRRSGDASAGRDRRRGDSRARRFLPGGRGRPGARILTVRGFLDLVRRDVLLAFRQGGEVGLAIGFFVLAVVLFPFGVGPEPEVLRRIGAGIIWVAA